MDNKLKPYDEYQETSYDWLPMVPKHWSAISIRAITQLSDKRNKERTDLELLSVYRDYGVIRKSSRSDNHNVESQDVSNYKYVNVGNLVMNKMKMWQGSLGVSKYEGIVSPAYIVCEVCQSMNNRYLHYLLRSAIFKTFYNRISYGVRVGQWDLRYDDFKSLRIYLPPDSEQNQIVKYLDWKLSKINKFIRAKKKQIELLIEQKEVMISKAVTKGIDSNVKMKNSGIEWIGYIPEDWDIKQLRQILTPVSVKNRPYLPLLSVVREQGIILRDIDDYEKNHNFIPEDLSGYKVVEKEQFVMNKMKAWQGSYGVSNYVGIVSPAYFVFNLHFENKDFFHYAIRSRLYVDYFARSSDGIRIGQWDLSLQKMKEIPFVIPTDDIQKEIAEYIMIITANIDNTIEKINTEINLITEYRTTLISDVVTGKVDVRNIVVENYFNEGVELEEMDESDEETMYVDEFDIEEEV